MYYKITNKECEVYKKLHDLRTEELLIQEENEKAIEQKTGLKFKTFLGDGGQQNFRRVRQYTGFRFTTPDKVDLNIWKIDKVFKEIFVPNLKTKAGREMSEFLLNGLKGSRYDRVWEILELERLHKFTFPYVEIYGEIILIFLPAEQEPKDINVIEITKREFEDLQGLSCRPIQ